MKTMSIAHDHSTNIIIQAEKNAASVLNALVNFISKTPWIFAFLILITFGFVYTVIAYVPLQFSRRMHAKRINKILADLNSFAERDVMLMHADVEEAVGVLEDLTKKTDSFFVFKPLNKNFLLILEDCKRFERALFAHCYPDYEKELSPTEVAELIEAFKPWKEELKSEVPQNG